MLYSAGFTITEDIQDAILKIPAGAWTPAYDGDGEVRDGAWVAEITGMLNLDGWPAGMRVIVRKERPYPGAQLRFTDIDGHRFTCFATSTTGGQLPDLELRHRRRARCEDRILPWGLLRRVEPDLCVCAVQRLMVRRYRARQVWCKGDTRVHRRVVVLSCAMSSRLAALAAARSWSRSSSCMHWSMTCCSRMVILWLMASMSAGAPSPDSFHAWAPSASDSRCSSWRT